VRERLEVVPQRCTCSFFRYTSGYMYPVNQRVSASMTRHLCGIRWSTTVHECYSRTGTSIPSGQRPTES
jgi:hypothetical protein